MGEPLRILMVDDEEIIYQTISSYLLDLGHQVDRAYNASKALEAVKKKEYDLAMVDIRMPGMDGISLMSKIMEIRPEMLVVIITGYGNFDMAIKSIKLGAIDFLTKPVRLIEIDAVLEKASRLRMYALQHSSDIKKLKSVEERLQAEIAKRKEAERRIAQLLKNQRVRRGRIDGNCSSY